KPVRPNTIAKSLAIGNPADGPYAAKIIKGTGGHAEDVTDEEVVDGIKLLARTEGLFTETAGGVTIGVLKKLAASGKIASDETVVAFITGSGYKTIEAVAGRTAVLHDIPPALEAFRSLHQRVKGARSVPGTPPLESVGA
ncbi:MAG TPA: pyridoxal-phosphate dependent enzyme, partial [Elusimicrobiota bacterium]|nr:pyridoxal-phosphate dependent enzyme [Elusimicrobiota bacterium]